MNPLNSTRPTGDSMRMECSLLLSNLWCGFKVIYLEKISTMAIINCKECNGMVSDKAKACPKCGAPVVIVPILKCEECGQELEPNSKTCKGCGYEKNVTVESNNYEATILPETSEAPTSRNKIIIATISVIFILICSFFVYRNYANTSYGGNSDSNETSSESYFSNENHDAPPREKTPEELKEELLNKESKNPSKYISINYSLSVKVHLLKASEDVIKGTIINSATMATFKDVKVKVSFETNTGAVLDSKMYTIYEFVKPNSTKNFQIKVNSPSGTTKIGVDFVSAKAE